MEFKNLQELITRMPDEASCREYFENMRWNGNPVCPHCNHNKAYKLKDGKTYKCAAKTCYKKFTVTTGTVFESSNIPLNKWFIALYLVTAHKKGLSSCQLAKDISVCQKSAWFMIHRIREILRNKTITKMNDIVQSDESFIGGRNKNRHAHKRVKGSQGRSHKDKTPVLGLMQNGQVNLTVVPNTQGETLKPIIEQLVTKGAILITDDWEAYNAVSHNYSHVVIDHRVGEHARGAFHTNGIEGFWTFLKRSIYGIYHQASPKHLQRYCDENAYRFNTRKAKDSVRFNACLKRTEGRLKYNDLIGKK